jgi:Flp pilus assembly protein TadD
MTPERRSTLLNIAIWSSLIVATLIVYGQTFGFEFVNFDDPQYVYDNPHVQTGVTPGTIAWAFTSQTVGNWIPVTMLSHILVSQLFGGASSGAHHLVNVLLHLLAAGLLLMFLERATGERVASAFVALVFAIHPLHVESVAWIAERKDVLSAVFFFLALYTYVRYTERPGLWRYLGVITLFSLGLLSKPMVITLPFVLVLLDFWPLRRIWSSRLLWEKLPLLVLSIGESAGTYFIQDRLGSLQTIPLSLRIENALIGYVRYIAQTFWPLPLSVFYPYPLTIAPWKVAIAAAVLLAISILAIASWRSRPYLAVGWFWYLGMLVPVVGFVQTGYQSHADRYTYLPMVGLTVMLAWAAIDLAERSPNTIPFLTTAAAVAVLAFTVTAFRQVTYWQNSEALYQHALDVTENNWLAHSNLGTYLNRFPDRRGEAISHLEAALRIRPSCEEAENNLGTCFAEAGLCYAAIPHFEAALRQTPNQPAPNANLGRCLLISGRYGDAVNYLQKALRRQPDDARVRLDLGEAFSKLPSHEADAVVEFQAVARSNPDSADAHHSLGRLLIRLGRTKEAVAHLEAEQRIRPTAETAKQLADLRAIRQ